MWSYWQTHSLFSWTIGFEYQRVQLPLRGEISYQIQYLWSWKVYYCSGEVSCSRVCPLDSSFHFSLGRCLVSGDGVFLFVWRDDVYYIDMKDGDEACIYFLRCILEIDRLLLWLIAFKYLYHWIIDLLLILRVITYGCECSQLLRCG